MLENGLEKCSCKRKNCERFGKCGECIAYHETHGRYKLPYCKRKRKGSERPDT